MTPTEPVGQLENGETTTTEDLLALLEEMQTTQELIALVAWVALVVAVVAVFLAVFR